MENTEIVLVVIDLARLFLEMLKGPVGSVLCCASGLVGLGGAVWAGFRWFYDNATEGF